MIGCAVAALLRKFPLAAAAARRHRPDAAVGRRALGVELADPATAAGGCDLVVHASASSAGLQRSLELLGDEGEVIELSWYGTQRVSGAARARSSTRAG